MENKTSKYFKYAIGEIVLVVIGILIALQINNWNELRKDSIKEKAYLERLKQDITYDSNQLDLNEKFYRTVFNYGHNSLLYLEDGKYNTNTNWDILLSFFHASQIWSTVTTSSTYEELKSSGELSLIKSVELRDMLSFFHGRGLNRYNLTIGINPPYRKMVRGLIPSKVQNYMWDKCHITQGDVQILTTCEPLISEEEAKQVLIKLSQHPKLIEELRFYMSSIKVGLDTILEQQKLCESMLNVIENSLQDYD